VSATERTAHGHEADPELGDLVRELSDRIEALQADVRRLGGPGLPPSEPGWDDEVGSPGIEPSYAWVSSVGAPVRRRPGVPRVLLEVLFLAAAAAAAAAARLDAPVIAGVMAGAWVLVALIEWAAARADSRRDAIPVYAPSAPAEPLPADPSWFVPPVEQTLVENAEPGESPTLVAKLPPPADDVDATMARPPGG
jgi:hypothetical protein